MITLNVFQRVFQIKVANATATCFAIDIEDKQYLVTARHVIEYLKDGQCAEIFHKDQWKNIPLTIVGKCDGQVDVAVLATNIQIAPAIPLDASPHGMALGQDIYYLGFPYGWSGEIGSINRDFPLPFVKKAILSCAEKSDGLHRLFLDGHNNPGFSGGPVVFKEANKKDFKVAAIISGYLPQREPIFDGEKQLPLKYIYNTGIIVSYSIQHALDLVKANPVGAEITPQ